MQHTQAIIGAGRQAGSRAGFLRSTWFRVAVRTSQIVADALLVFAAFWLAYEFRYGWQLGGPVRVSDFEPFSVFQSRAYFFAAFTLLTFFARGIYRLPRSAGFLDEVTLVMGGVTTAMAVVIMTAFLSRFVPSRLVFIYAWALAIALLLIRRFVTQSIRRALWSRGLYVDRVLVVGAGEPGRRIMQALMGMPAFGYRLVGFVDDLITEDGLAIATEAGLDRANLIGTTDDIERVVQDYGVDEVIIALPATEQKQILSIIEHCRKQAVVFKVVPDLLQLSLDQVDVAEVAGVPLIGFKNASIQGVNFVLKRFVDIAISLSVLVLMMAPMAIIALLIRADSQGPALYRQRRVGKSGHEFTLTKFRCMVADADDRRAALMAEHDHMDARLFKLRDDPRLTKVGRVLRRLSLDELPQFWHILRGEMSFVGPRPQLPEEVETYEEWHLQRLLVTPGLTGLWQINGRSNLTFDEMVRLDLYYAENWTPWLDMKIVLRTIPAVVTGRGAY